MNDPTCKSLEALVPMATAKLSKTPLPEQFETYRSELHRQYSHVLHISLLYWSLNSGELARQWPFRSETSHPLNVAPVASKSTAHASLGAPQKPALTANDDDSVHQAHSKLRSNNLTPLNSEIAPRIVAANSDVSLEGAQQPIEWNVKAQEGIITYHLPDGLPDGAVLHDKLQQLMKTSTIYLNDRRFWNTLEERFKARRKVTNDTFGRRTFFSLIEWPSISSVRTWNGFDKRNSSTNKNWLLKAHSLIPPKTLFVCLPNRNGRWWPRVKPRLIIPIG